MRKITYIFLFLGSVITLNAQTGIQLEEHQQTTINNPWLQLDNAAGLGVSKVKPHGITELAYQNEGGNYRRAQQGNERNGLNFYSERFDKIGKNWSSWGSFNFTLDREKNRAWSDVFSTYNSNPYIYGSSLAGNYDRQMFDFRIKLSSSEINRLTYGFGVDYLVGDLARLRDPRTRVFLADYGFLPALVFRIDNVHRIGMNLKVAYRKEKMPNITTLQDDPNLKYFSFFGVENADAVVAGYKGFQRQFVSNVYGGELQYALKTYNVQLVIAAGANYEQQQILENIKQSPGAYEAVNYVSRIASNVVSNGLMYNLTLHATLKAGAADENIQKLISTQDISTGVNSQNWETLFTYHNRYVNSAYSSKFNFDIRNINAEKSDFSWLVGAESTVSGFVNQYNLPFSKFATNRFNVSLYGHYRIMNRNNNRLTLHAKVGYNAGFNNAFHFSSGATDVPELGASTFKQGTYEVATQIYLPDLAYFDDTSYNALIEAKYSMPLNFKKFKMTGYVRANYSQELARTLGSWSKAAVAIGIIP